MNGNTGANGLSFNEFSYFTAQIEAAQIITDYVEYVIRVTASAAPELPGQNWVINRRYSDFDALHRHLRAFNGELPLPPKKMFFNLDRDFIASRQAGLQAYMDILFAEPILASSKTVCQFFTPANGDRFDYQEKALQYVSMDFRCDSPWEVVQPCEEMGTRLRKTYILVKNRDSSSADRYYLAWSDYGTEPRAECKVLMKTLKSLTTLKHPFIYPVTAVSCDERGAFLIRPFTELGSLRDLINGTKPQNSCLKKYARLKQYQKLSMESLRVFSRQILEGLRFLHERGWPYGHLTLRNVLLVRPDTCALTDIENLLLGHTPQIRPQFVQLKRNLTLEQLDVYCFGRCLYELVFGVPMKRPTLDGEDLNCSLEIKTILESLLTAEAIKEGIPSVDTLLMRSFFTSVPLRLGEKPIWKISSQSRDAIESLRSQWSSSLLEDQRLLHATRQRRHTEVRLEEERRMRKQETRRRRSHTTQPKTGNGSVSNVGDADSKRVTSTSSLAQINDRNSTVPPVTPTACPPVVETNEPGATAKSPDPVTSTDPKRSSMLSAITQFNKSGLRRASTMDRSSPKL